MGPEGDGTTGIGDAPVDTASSSAGAMTSISRREEERDSMDGHTGVQHIHGFCGLCIARCGTVATVDDGRFTRLDPDPSHPTGDAICAKGRAAPELVYHPERLTHPLRRTRPKGDPDPGWQRIGWDEALDLTSAAWPTGTARTPSPSPWRRAPPPPSETPRASSSGWRTRSARRTRRSPSTSAAGDAPSPPSTPTAWAASASVAVAPCRTSSGAAC